MSPNRLINEKSPYLLQHAYNPVDWFPWCEEAFKRANEENKPVFVSIGYSTCHWCHVMEKESFEDQQVANLLNEHFISIKVDREERPDIDSIYMNVCQMLTGQGGWPLHVFLTADQKPFFAGTYFPKERKYGSPGMLDLLPQLFDAYKKETDRIEKISEQLTVALKESTSSSGNAIPSNIADVAYNELANLFDSQYGGFGTAPKFPTAGQLLFLLRYFHATKEDNALNMVEITLDGIARGGIYDHIGFGFARYSTDEMWLVPHFEKMLYDQAMLLHAYTETYQITNVPQYKAIVYDTIQFIEREMLHPEGGFYSAIDADSEGEEGTYYIWSFEEIIETLGPEEGFLFAKAFDITKEGNFESKNIPNLIYTDAGHLVDKYGISLDELEDKLERSRQKLFAFRQNRVSPHVDDKILTSWNGLTIAALAKAGATFTEPKFIDLATTCLQFIEHYLMKEDKLYARYRDGEAKHLAYLDDYAYLLFGIIELHQATGNDQYIDKAKNIAHILLTQFEDLENGGFYFTNNNAERLLVREKSALDNAYPSGNGMAAMQLWRLSKIAGDNVLAEKAEQILTAFADDITAYPTAVLSLLNVHLAFSSKVREIKITGNQEAYEVLSFLHTTYRPYDVWTINQKTFAPFSVQICQNHVCQIPLKKMADIIEELS
ncbi:thioredoxin domain-containing protein [Bacillus sp. FJAT-22090]|uniref:thioredoxin domain-containing protein n=1 Tax=Bacillus sp. FJAT-22090 TaxID=1581038 RepID=UPI0011A5558B|nr:thioredoxin domain-containing protein [Bacillus sp. FJAT-22090]